MLKSYEAIYEDGQFKWLQDKPMEKSARVIVTILEATEVTAIKRRSPSPLIAGKGETIGDIVSPIVDEEDWGYLK
ncbi:hypothetical protein ACN4EG_15620 [Alkalinema pantanalense CENA528]|uniref:hypothetical protein n=1 Tax=Alkalinema pantanalense TaxID=1620705 RepID=UPI003D6DF7D2